MSAGHYSRCKRRLVSLSSKPNEDRYNMSKSTCSFRGFATCYPYFYYDRTNADLRRMRISQFVILPHYQGKSHGARLYDFIFTTFWNKNNIREITVEDPNESFDDLRDRCDLRRLQMLGVMDDPGFTIPLKPEWVKAQKEKAKIPMVCVRFHAHASNCN